MCKASRSITRTAWERPNGHTGQVSAESEENKDRPIAALRRSSQESWTPLGQAVPDRGSKKPTSTEGIERSDWLMLRSGREAPDTVAPGAQAKFVLLKESAGRILRPAAANNGERQPSRGTGPRMTPSHEYWSGLMQQERYAKKTNKLAVGRPVR